MKKIRTVCLGCAAVWLLLGAGAWGQKRLPISGSGVPPISGQTPTVSGPPDGRGSVNGTLLTPTDDMGDSSVRRNMEALRANAANTERQRALTRESAQLLQMAAELQLKIAGNGPGISPEEMMRQVDAIEKLARTVKDRMKGAR